MAAQSDSRHEKQKKFEADVVVVGGGTAGVPAAIAAARNGVRCILVERYGFLGGTINIIPAMAGFQDRNGRQIVGGLPNEIVQRVIDLGGSSGHIPDPVGESVTFVDREIYKYAAMDMAIRAGVKTILHSFFFEADRKNGNIQSVRICNKSGVQTVAGKIFVDCTGDADLASTSGVPCRKEEILQPVTMTFRMAGFDMERLLKYVEEHPEELEKADTWSDAYSIEHLRKHKTSTGFKGLDKLVERVKRQTGYEFPRDRVHFGLLPRKGEVLLNTTRVTGVDPTDVEALTKAEIESRIQVMEEVSFLKKNVPGFESTYLLDTSVQVGVRESRKIEGEYTLTGEDTLNGRQFDDAIAKGVYPVDQHDAKGRGMRIYRVKKPYSIPYRVLVPKNVDTLLVAGRCISATREGLASPRTIPTCMAMGQAAGTAAALSVKRKTSPRCLDVRVLQRTLRKQGVLI